MCVDALLFSEEITHTTCDEFVMITPGYGNLLVFARLYEPPRRERDPRIHEALALMNLAAFPLEGLKHDQSGSIRYGYAWAPRPRSRLRGWEVIQK